MRVSLSAFLLASLLGDAQAGRPAPKHKVGQPVWTTGGLAVGQASPKRSGVSEYLGVPFAQPPTGAHRWAPPRKLARAKHGTVLNATRYAASCAESASLPYRTDPDAPPPVNIGASENEQSEDCLYLNIWTKPQAGERKKAVMVWIHGGGFVVGSGNNAVYNGASLAEDSDVVLVSVNYRLGVLGFPGVAIPEKNLGLLDQRAAVEWVRDNIAQFGGDPKRIILFGQSAGAGSVDFYSYAWTKDPIVSGFIPQSGSAALRPSAPTNVTLKAWSDLSGALGCGPVASEETVGKSLECMKAADVNAVLKATAPSTPGGTLGVWGPKIDGKTVFADLAERGKAGKFIKAPMLVGNTGNEGATSGDVPGSRESKLRNCGSAAAALVRRNVGVPAWRYLYNGEFPNQVIGANITGAWHGAEIALIFGNTGVRGPDTENEKKLIKKMQAAWSGFAKDPKRGLSKLGWPLYDESKDSVIVIGGNDSDEISYQSTSVTDEDVCKASA